MKKTGKRLLLPAAAVLVLALVLVFVLRPGGGEGETGDGGLRCGLRICCGSVLEHMDSLAPEKRDLVPADGVLYSGEDLPAEEGDTVFDLLLRETRAAGIHMEFTGAPVYVEGIGNLYEFDCGPASGWTYTVNGEYPDLGCGQYALADGDTVEWIYTCS